MKNKTQLSIRAKLLFYMVFIVFLTQSCVGMVRHKDMELISKIDNPQILNLRASKSMSLAFLRQGEKLVNGCLCKNIGEEYGYYVVKYNTIREDASANLTVSYIYGALLCGVLFLFGCPTDCMDFWMEANLYIFDSNGVLIKKYSDGDVFSKVAGIYYGHEPTVKAGKAYSEVYDRIFRRASQDAEYINTILKKNGAVQEGKDEKAESNIKAFLDAE